MKRICLVLGLLLIAASPAEADFNEFEIESVAASLSSYQAGAHADFTTFVDLKTELAGGEVVQTRDLRIDLPPGLLGNPTAVPQCTMLQLGTDADSSHCPLDSQVGISELKLAGFPVPIKEPIYNMTSPGGNVVARLGFLAGFYPTTINVRIRSDDDYGATANIEGAAAAAGLKSAKTTIWGVPGSELHDSQRITPSEGESGKAPPGGGRSSTLAPVPFLSNPTRCGVSLEVGFSATSYQLPQSPVSKAAPLSPISGCGKVSFAPSFQAQPTTQEAATPSGIDVVFSLPQDETPQGRATAHLRDAKVTFPLGMTLAAGAADGLGACSAAEVGYESLTPADCPSPAKLGSVELDVPALVRPIQGALYQRTPTPGHQFRVWIAADDLGVHVALPGEIYLDPRSGQVTSMFLDNPQVPLREMRLHIPGGPRAPFTTPSSCGTHRSTWQMRPWSGDYEVSGDAPMRIDGNCETGGFAPAMKAGTRSGLAGAFSPFILDLYREPEEQNISGLSLVLPSGLLARLKNVPVCHEDAAMGGGCPPATAVGSVVVASGPGTNPLWIPQPGKSPAVVYLGGAYKGAPYSLVASVPVQAGPFDLGTVIVRSAIRIDRETARVSIDSDPLPQIVEGVPVSYRRLHVAIERPKFTLNATNCSRKEIQGVLLGSQGATAKPTDLYRATSCRRLPYQPHLSLRLTGGSRRNLHPALNAKLTQRLGEAGNAQATVILPPSQFIDQAHIGTSCTRVQFNANHCPPRSILGRARAVTPLLGEPLKGPVYFRSNGGARELPDIVADLRGPFRLAIIGFVDSVPAGRGDRARVRTTFARLPDAPVRSFTMHLFGGKRGLLVNSTNLCSKPQRASVELRGQNGDTLSLSPDLHPSCK
jgi:hypothetical protein